MDSHPTGTGQARRPADAEPAARRRRAGGGGATSGGVRRLDRVRSNEELKVLEGCELLRGRFVPARGDMDFSPARSLKVIEGNLGVVAYSSAPFTYEELTSLVVVDGRLGFNSAGITSLRGLENVVSEAAPRGDRRVPRSGSSRRRSVPLTERREGRRPLALGQHLPQPLSGLSAGSVERDRHL